MSDDDLTSLRDRCVLITGADGMLGRGFAEAIRSHSPSTPVIARSHAELDVTNLEAVMQLAAESPDIIVHCAGLSSADACERNPALARQVHVGGTANVVRLAREVSARIVYPQSVFIFDGRELPVTENTTPAPAFQYGRAKLEAECLVLAASPDSLVVRMAGFFGGEEKDKNFVGQFTRTMEKMLADGIGDVEVGDRIWQPTYTLDLANNCLLLLARGKRGIFHMGALGEATFHEVAAACVNTLGLRDRIRVIPSESKPFDDAEPARRPARMVTRNDRLDAEGLNRQRYWNSALDEYLRRPYFDRLRNV